MKNNLKKLCLYIIWILLILFTFVLTIIEQYINKTTKSVIGSNVWFIIYIILPILILIAPFVIKRFFQNKRAVIIYLLLYIVYIFIITITPTMANKYIRVFTIDKWMQHRYERVLMLEDLNSKYPLGNMTKEDVQNILGKPDFETENEIEYVVSAGWFDPEMLVLRFENQLVVEEYTYIEFKSNKLNEFKVD